MEEQTTIPWSEFHYHFFSWLIDEHTPRPLAMGIELQIFPASSFPNVDLLKKYVQALEDSQEPDEFTLSAIALYNQNRVGNQQEYKLAA